MSDRKVFTETMLSHVYYQLNNSKVVTLKKACAQLSIGATWYNHALKEDLKKAIVFQLDRYGITKDQLEALVGEVKLSWPYMFNDWGDWSLMKEPDHKTQYYVRGERADYTQATTWPIWHFYFPRTGTSSSGNSGPFSTTIMDQRWNPHREWPNNGDPDPKGLFQGEPGAKNPEPEPEPEPTATQILSSFSGGAKVDPKLLQTTKGKEPGTQLEEAMAGLLVGALGTKVEEAVQNIGLTKEAMEKMIREVFNESTLPVVKQIPDPTKGEPSLRMVHKNFEDAEFWMRYGYSVYLNGPSGSGKTVAATQLAELFEEPLTIISCHGEMTVYDLTGFTDGHGNYKETEFYKAWRDGKFILMDEVDKAPGEVNVLLNAALAQGTITFPVGTMTKKKSTKLIFTGNTKMSGADAIYSAGQRQDGSFSNRMVAVEWPFDESLERALAEQACQNTGGTGEEGAECHAKIKKIREAIDDLGMPYVVGQRQSMMYAAATGAGRDKDSALEEVVYGWMDRNDANRIKEVLSK